MRVDIHHLNSSDLPMSEALLAMFGEAFNDRDTYTGKKPTRDYLQKLLAGETFIALAAIKD